ncbi:hypothetical protein [Burkholderia cenocepacia]|uniref:hypothetical protein n=1 Tax=Burkholderia cenocepacia TaxID=95486 RepID=UPI001639CC13|nr:hypothetical protein [Burkholderia cenocepacia]MBR8511445.1 hypothetical protein [Burkholderia cenocepacia]
MFRLSRDIQVVLMRVSTREMTPPHASAAAFFLAGTARENVNAWCTAARRLPIVNQ